VAFNYGVFAVYRTQQYDIPSYYTKPGGAAVVSNPVVSPDEYVRRDANAGIGSLWARFQWDKLRIEAEAVGIGGIINGTSTQSSETENPVLTTVDGPQPLMVLQGGAAVESSYKLLNDQFIIGLDGGIASGDDAFGFGLRPVINQAPRAGDFDGLQYGQCLEYAENGECARVDTTSRTSASMRTTSWTSSCSARSSAR
jgi:hypothetical protein